MAHRIGQRPAHPMLLVGALLVGVLVGACRRQVGGGGESPELQAKARELEEVARRAAVEYDEQQRKAGAAAKARAATASAALPAEGQPRIVVRADAIGAPTVRGSLDKGLIQRIVRTRLIQVKWCYDAGLRARPGAGLAGRVVVRVTIDPSGGVREAKVGESTLGAPDVEQCLARVLAGCRFPPPHGGGIVLVDYPFSFTDAAPAPRGPQAARRRLKRPVQ